MRKDVVEFNSIEEYQDYLKKENITTREPIGSGSEGSCYIVDRETVMKVIDQEGYGILDYDPDDMITESDLKLDSFAFPKKLFVVDNCVVGYTTKYVEQDYFKIFNEKTYELNDPGKIDFDKLIEAYKKMQKDVEVLSDNYISIFDLSHNLMFDGENLVGIDTLGYERNSSIREQDNQASLDLAIITQFSEWTKFIFGKDYFEEEHDDKNVIDSLKNIEKTYVPKIEQKVYKKK